MLGVAGWAPVERWARGGGLRFAARRFVAGATVDEALPALRDLERLGRAAIVDVLGEYVSDRREARAMGEAVGALIAGLAGAGFAPVVSVKPTQFGLAIDPELAADLAGTVARGAEQAGGRVCLDMEDHRFVDGTLGLLRRLHAEGAPATSTVLQAYLRRTPDDLAAVVDGAPPGSELRVVKGAYHEPATVALRDAAAIHGAFLDLCERAWRAGFKVNVATHDEGLIREANAFARGAGVPRDRRELQLLYGVRPALQARLMDAGHPVRIYVPIGADWYGYFSRRLAERPANAALVLRGLFG